MFTDDDVRTAKPVHPSMLQDEFATKIMSNIIIDGARAMGVTAMAPAVVVLSMFLLTTPKGSVLESVKPFIESAIQVLQGQKQLPDSHSDKEGSTHIEANNSNVQNVHLSNSGSNVNIVVRTEPVRF